MKKILLFLFAFSTFISANERNIDLENKINNEYLRKEEKLKKDNLKNNLMDFNKINISTGIDYSKNTAGQSLIQNNSINYAFISYNLSFDLLNKNISNHSINASKTINEYFYNRIDENRVDYLISKHNLELEKEKDFFEKLELLKKYKLQEKIVELNQKEKNKIEQDIKNIEKSYQLGAISKFDYEVAKSKLDLSQLQFSLDKDTLDQLKTNILYEELVNESLDLEFDNKKVEDNLIRDFVKRKYINIEELKISKLEYNSIKDLVLNKIPLITPSVGYDIKNNGFMASLNITKTFDIVTNEYDDIKELKQEIQNKKDKLKLLEEKMFIEEKNIYNALLFKYIANNTTVKNLEYELKILERKFELGSENFINLLNKRNELHKAKINLEESMLDVIINNLKYKRGVK
ncbi:TolC family protein [Streptobacillus felis]|uniref:TolC family protein n=1 Tax=Streptobacillus felis TaxID=1384509 RepID=A0A7Z0PDP3_9FUSO|nr:TolC family protein [Streptobacillus felis]NYV27354.1 TolC family protein [Streptobacillus felis]